MSACAICPEPGSCCREFKLDRWFPRQAARQEVQDWIAKLKDSDGRDHPFVAVEPLEEDVEAGGREVRWVFRCPELRADGRCGIYDERPYPCREYQPGRDGMCALHAEGFELALPVV